MREFSPPASLSGVKEMGNQWLTAAGFIPGPHVAAVTIYRRYSGPGSRVSPRSNVGWWVTVILNQRCHEYVGKQGRGIFPLGSGWIAFIF